ncbi:hypothetical protein IFM89_010983 [Coptis chinensis]|uniref:Endonuclease/exonuclease/phosphatase domain-containing protein n=1 Tax=Coptis chinensis TaxID=261450 RepID=A0A835IRC6_9MAGN|nr:hypothetical protein IFM89_010983 [Coptis chinensis]
MGSSEAIHSVSALVKKFDPDVLFLVETKLLYKKLKHVQKKLKYPQVFAVDHVGRSGGLAVLYKDNIYFSAVDGNKNDIFGTFLNYLSNVSWHVSFIYGDPVAHKRIVVWNYLRDLRNVLSGPWLILGDFNAITSLSEKILRWPILAIMVLLLLWLNNRLGAANIRERIHHVVANDEWLNLFPLVSVDHVTTPSSDHVALVVYVSRKVDSGPKPFRFHEMWTKDPYCMDVIQHCWQTHVHGSPSFNLNSKLVELQSSWRVWNKTYFGNIFSQIKEAKSTLSSLLVGPISDLVLVEIKNIKEHILELYKKEESYWNQHSNTSMVLEVDNNTKFFHSNAGFRRRRNSIDKIQNEAGLCVTSRPKVA